MLLVLVISGGWPAAMAADSLARIWGEPGIDCHSTSMGGLCCVPHSTKMLPTASSVTVFQLAENQTANLPLTGPACGTAVACGGPPVGPQAASTGVTAPAAAAASRRISARRDRPSETAG